jgi:hypothetical protein
LDSQFWKERPFLTRLEGTSLERRSSGGKVGSVILEGNAFKPDFPCTTQRPTRLLIDSKTKDARIPYIQQDLLTGLEGLALACVQSSLEL